VDKGALVPGGDEIPGSEVMAGPNSLFIHSHESHPFPSVPLSQSPRSRLHKSFRRMMSSAHAGRPLSPFGIAILSGLPGPRTCAFRGTRKES
jgi:hypothetical protein